MRTELTKLHQNVGTTFIYVTHDQVEAMTMGTRIVCMKDGIIQQVAAPQVLYEYPANLFVATFIGTPQMNIFDATLLDEGGHTYIKFGENKLQLPDEKGRNPEVLAYADQPIICGIRPECISDDAADIEKEGAAVITCEVDVVEQLGSVTYLYLTNEKFNFTASVNARSKARHGDTVKVALDMNRIHLFDKETEHVIAG